MIACFSWDEVIGLSFGHVSHGSHPLTTGHLILQSGHCDIFLRLSFFDFNSKIRCVKRYNNTHISTIRIVRRNIAIIIIRIY